MPRKIGSRSGIMISYLLEKFEIVEERDGRAPAIRDASEHEVFRGAGLHVFAGVTF